MWLATPRVQQAQKDLLVKAGQRVTPEVRDADPATVGRLRIVTRVAGLTVVNVGQQPAVRKQVLHRANELRTSEMDRGIRVTYSGQHGGTQDRTIGPHVEQFTRRPTPQSRQQSPFTPTQ